MSTNLSQAVSEAAEYLRARLPARPDLALVLGSGLGGLADRIEDPVYIPYGQISPAFLSPPRRATRAGLCSAGSAAAWCCACRGGSTITRATTWRPSRCRCGC